MRVLQNGKTFVTMITNGTMQPKHFVIAVRSTYRVEFSGAVAQPSGGQPGSLGTEGDDRRTAEMAATVRAADARQWLPGDHIVTARLRARPRAYTVTAALMETGGKPAIRLACDAPENGLCHRIGTVQLKE